MSDAPTGGLDGYQFVPVTARARLAAALLAPPAAIVLLAARFLDSAEAVAALTLVLAVVVAGSIGLAFRVGLRVDHDGVEIRNLRRRVQLTKAEIGAIGERRVGIGPLRTQVVELRGPAGATPATVTAAANRRELAPLYVTLRRWSADAGIEDDLERLEFLDRRTRARLLACGDDVAVPCHLRRLSSRGWGPWIGGWLRLPPGGGAASWRADDPSDVALVQAYGERPVWVRDAVRLEQRPVRYRAEAFYADATDIVVYVTDRTQMELACAGAELRDVVARLRAAPQHDAGSASPSPPP